MEEFAMTDSEELVGEADRGGLRLALYSPGMVGIGHMRRNLLIAQALAGSPVRPVILMIAEAREANVLTMPPRGDCLTLPALRKEIDGECRPRYLDLSLDAVTRLRARLIAAAIESFGPDVLIVDHLPRGALRELDATLEELRGAGHCRCVLGLRDVLEDPERVRREWSSAGNEEAIRDYYDAVWIYGDPTVYDPVREYGFSAAMAAKVRYTGYLDCRLRSTPDSPELAQWLEGFSRPGERLILCTVGGGQDGANLAEAFVQTHLPPGTRGVLLTGPFMPPAAQGRLRLLAMENRRLHVLPFVTNPDMLLARAERVIAMGGYNTVYEVLSYEKHALIVPRFKPRHEQRIRAERLGARGLLHVLQPEEVGPGALARWLACDLGPPPRARGRIDLNGVARLPGLLQEVLAGRPGRAHERRHESEVVHARA
jgi:predicted glycosyltransferase